jgi:hypothetical protein
VLHAEDDTEAVHRVPLPLDTGLASDLKNAIDRSANSDVVFFCLGLQQGADAKPDAKPLHAHSVLLMSRSTYFEQLLFPLLGAKDNQVDAHYYTDDEPNRHNNNRHNNGDPIEIEVPDSREVMYEVMHFLYTGHVRSRLPSHSNNNTPPSSTAKQVRSRRETLLSQVEWMMLLLKASRRYDIPRMRVLVESVVEGPLVELNNPMLCLSLLPEIADARSTSLLELCLSVLSSSMHRVVESKGYASLCESRPGLIRMLVERVKERDLVRRWDAGRQEKEVERLDALLKRVEGKEEDLSDNSFMRHDPFPWRVIGFGMFVVTIYFYCITNLPPAQRGWIPMMNILATTVGFVFVARSLTD